MMWNGAEPRRACWVALPINTSTLSLQGPQGLLGGPCQLCSGDVSAPCTHTPQPFPSTTVSVNSTPSLHLSPHLTSRKLLTSLCVRALKHSSLASPTPHLPGCLVSQGPDPLWGLLFHHPARKWGRSHVSSPPVSPQETSRHCLALEPCPQGGLQLGYCLVSKSCPTLGVEPPWSEIQT